MFEAVNTEDINELNLTQSGLVKPSSTGLTALVDADTIVYTTCLELQYVEDVMPRDFYTDEQWEEIINNPTYDENLGTIRDIDLDLAKETFYSRLGEIIDLTGCVGYECHFSYGSRNFRYDLYPEYKGNRDKSVVPAGNSKLKKLLSVEDNMYLHTVCEADDIVVSEYLKTLEETHGTSTKYTLCAIDKDVLNSVRGKHFNYYRRVFSDGRSIDPKFVMTSNDKAWLNPYKQTLTGDPQDNIIGLYRVGDKKADKLLADVVNDEQAWEVVMQAYRTIGTSKQENEEIKKGYKIPEDVAKDRAILNMRLVNMNQIDWNKEATVEDDYILNLWSPNYDSKS